MRTLSLTLLFLFSSCNFFSAKVDISEYLFSSKERQWSLIHPDIPDGTLYLHHIPFKEGSRSFVKVVTKQGRIYKEETYEIKEDSIDLVRIKDWSGTREVTNKSYPRFMKVGDVWDEKQILYKTFDKTSIREATLNLKSIEIANPEEQPPTFHVYAQGQGLVVVSQRNVLDIAGNKMDDIEMWVNPKDLALNAGK